ncbi:MAG: FAD-dependent oxidoreductase [Desulfobacula sp.]|jgi:pyruvate/2-oxoglutarate dehydrogenase complex dihydrolipoamide dehydrogenase (E3) component|nr:FAD-dependent oxidoreductase [Desulfobacula sp.]
MSNNEYDIGVIGGGAAGLTIVSGAAQLGARVILIEQEKKLGGDCLHYGCVPSKTLIKSAHVYHQMKQSQNYGLPKLDIPPVDFRQVVKRIKSVIDTIQVHDSEERFCGLGAKVVFGQARFIDTHKVSLDGKIISADKWVIATGSSPVVPPIEGLADTPHLTNKEIFYMDKLPASMIILGAGPIGIEMGQAFNRLGTQVTVIDRAAQILGKEDKDMADGVMTVMSKEGVQFLLEAAITRVKNLKDARQVTIVDANGTSQDIKAEAILVSMGRSPNVDGLGLDEIGIKYDRRGIQVDNRLRTSHKHIYAAGDVNGGFQFTHAAGYEGGIVISNAVFRLPRKVDYTWLPWVTYTDPELASIGMNETAAKKAGLKYTLYTEAFKDNDRSLAEGEITGKIKLLLDEKEKPLGVQILGPGAGNLISEWVAVLNGNVKLSTIAAAIHPYPTMGEINKRVAGSYLSPKIFSKTIQNGLKFFFNLKGRACNLDE